jgi:hypothetical protein
LLTKPFDFRRFAFNKPSIIISQLKNYAFLHQFKIAFAQKKDLIPTMWAKKIQQAQSGRRKIV